LSGSQETLLEFDSQAALSAPSVTEGIGTQAEVRMRPKVNGRTVYGRGARIRTNLASVSAHVHAPIKLLVKRQKTAPEALSA